MSEKWYFQHSSMSEKWHFRKSGVWKKFPLEINSKIALDHHVTRHNVPPGGSYRDDAIGSVGFVPKEWVTAQATISTFSVLF